MLSISHDPDDVHYVNVPTKANCVAILVCFLMPLTGSNTFFWGGGLNRQGPEIVKEDLAAEIEEEMLCPFKSL